MSISGCLTQGTSYNQNAPHMQILTPAGSTSVISRPTAEEDEQEEDEPRHGVGHDEAAPNGAHAAEEVDGNLVRQEADQPEAEIPADTERPVKAHQHTASVKAIRGECCTGRPRAKTIWSNNHFLLDREQNTPPGFQNGA